MMRRAAAVVVAIVALGLSACTVASTPSSSGTPTNNGNGTPSQQWYSDIQSVTTDLGTISSDASTAATSQDQSDFDAVAADCQTLQTDVASLSSDPTPGLIVSDGDSGTYQDALQNLNNGATQCIEGADNDDVGALDAAGTDFGTAQTDVTQVANDVG